MNLVSLSDLTTMHVGGQAEAVRALDEAEVVHAVKEARSDRRPFVVIGEGSNLIVADAGTQARVIVYRNTIDISRIGEDRVYVDGGSVWDDVVNETLRMELYGLESLSGIPGTTGGALVQNIGAYGYELASFVETVRVYDAQRDQVVTLAGSQCGFAYRTSCFKQQRDGRFVVLGATLELGRNALHNPRYAELSATLRDTQNDGGEGYSPHLVRDIVFQLRRKKGMLYQPEDASTWSAGSFFTNPIVDARLLPEAAKAFDVLSDDVPHWQMDSGLVKLSAGWLIERSGVSRGTVRGGVRSSPLHALAITNNTGVGTANDVLTLARQMQQAVHERIGVILEPEPVFLGYDSSPLFGNGATIN